MTKPVRFLAGLVIVLLSPAVVSAETVSSVGVSYGGGYVARQDLVFSPMAHSSFTPLGLRVDYNRTARLAHRLSVGYAGYAPRLVPQYEFVDGISGETRFSQPHSFQFIGMSYAVGVPVAHLGRGAVLVGASLPQEVHVTSYSYGIAGVFGYTATFAAGVWSSITATVAERLGIDLQLSIPLFAWLARSPYLVNDDEYIENISSNSAVRTFAALVADGELVSLGRLQRVDIEVAVRYTITARLIAVGSARYRFDRVATPLTLLSYETRIWAGLEVRL